MSQRSIILQIGALGFCISLVALSLTGYPILKIVIISFIIFVIVTTAALIIVSILFPPTEDDDKLNGNPKKVKNILEKIDNEKEVIESDNPEANTSKLAEQNEKNEKE